MSLSVSRLVASGTISGHLDMPSNYNSNLSEGIVVTFDRLVTSNKPVASQSFPVNHGYWFQSISYITKQRVQQQQQQNVEFPYPVLTSSTDTTTKITNQTQPSFRKIHQELLETNAHFCYLLKFENPQILI